ncbi:restriction endonuclease subunit S [Alkalibacterium olivapovliticus]|uniref:Type I restriction enzyme S subunit n=1 Tax=Alkalibacterium olivapovliticus TaxID=99907 RepID=A0A2T0W881_9LACT|nr:restriction endonuclease subunit S [Alkalibacterium olivapovliticus]PRY82931.1 type I restriction enzyme S subunit [Alkalibacterium olivapovliticus]
MSISEDKSSPELRFEGFTDAWEQRGGSDIFKSISDKNHPELPVLSASQEKGMILRDDIGIDIKYASKSLISYKKVMPQQFVIHLRSFQGGFAYSLIEGITSPAYTIIDFKNKEEHDPSYWQFILSSRNFIKRLETVTYGIRDGRSISYSDFSTLKFNVPSINEQTQIGTFFLELDKTIALHQEKLSKLQELKKAYLQVMFSQDGENTPEIRITDFDKEWEQRNLLKVLKVNSGRDYKHLESGNIPVYGTGGYMLSVNQYLSDKDAIGIGRKGTINNPQYLVSPFWTVDTLFYMTVNKGYDLLFIYSMSQTINWKRFDESTGVPSLSKTTINNIIKCFPPYEEQVAIGKFFDKFETIVKFEQTILDELKNLKISYLQNMFI